MEGQKACKTMNIILIACFVVIMVIPLLSINRVEGKVSVVENKVLAAKPNLFMPDGTINYNYITEFESYFNENIGLRDSAMAANIIFKYKLFHVVDIPNWLMGEAGELFYTTGGEDIKVYTGETVFTQEEMQEMAENLISMNEYFRELGCETYNLFIPNKEAVYSERYNPYVYHEEKSRQDKFCEYLIENSELQVLNVKQALLEAKDQAVYYRTYDASHWNMNGAFIGYLELMSEIAKEHSDVKVLSREEFEITEEHYDGLNQYYDSVAPIKNAFHFEDTIYSYNLKEGGHYVVEQSAPGGMEIDANLNYYHYSNDTLESEHSMLIVGDSYMYCFMLPFLAESFRDVYFIRNTDAATIMKLTEQINPDIFVFEIAERVATKAYFDCMSGFRYEKKSNVDMTNVIHNGIEAQIHVDVPKVENSVLKIGAGNMEILGWGFDTQYDMKPKTIICEVNGSYIEAAFYYRQDLAEWDEKYANCGFNVKLSEDLIGQAEKIVFYVVAQDGSVYNGYEVMIQFD